MAAFGQELPDKYEERLDTRATPPQSGRVDNSLLLVFLRHLTRRPFPQSFVGIVGKISLPINEICRLDAIESTLFIKKEPIPRPGS